MRGGSNGPGAAAIRLMAAMLGFVSVAAAQMVPASISTINQPSFGHAVFDTARNVYYFGGPVSAGAAQTQPGGGTCYVATGFIGSIPEPCPDVQIVKVDPSGNEIWGTRLGGPTADNGTALAIDSVGNVLVTGSTGGQFPTTPGAAIVSSTTSTLFAAKVSADSSKFLYSTYLPASLTASTAIAVDGADNTYVVGKTSAGHAFVVKLSPDGSTILYNVTLAGSGVDAATAITIDASGNALVVGQTTSSDFPVTPRALQSLLKGAQNNFLVRLDPAGNVRMSTYLGGSGSDSPSSVAVDGDGNIDLAVATSSLDFPTTQGTLQASPIVPAWNNSSPAGFVAQVAPDGTELNWASYVMSSDVPGPPGTLSQVGVQEMAVTPAGHIFLGGVTGPGFPVTPSAPEICFQGFVNRTNGFLAHLNSHGALVDATYLGNPTEGDIKLVGGLAPLSANEVLVVWRGAGNGVLSHVQFGSGGWTAPACLSTDVLNAATQNGNAAGTGGIVPGELVTLTGFGIGPESGVAYQPDPQGNAPSQLAGVRVFFDGVAAPVLYAQSRQINTIAPAGLTIGGTTHVTVTYNIQQFGPVSTPVTFAGPGIFRLQVGQSAQAVAMNEDGTLNGPSNPAARGSVVTIWGTGYGLTDPPCSVGGLNDPQAEPLSAGVTALILGGSLFNASYAGSAPTLVCGVVQINFQVPANVAAGTFFFAPWIQLVVGNATTQYQPQLGATIAVK